MIKVAFVDNQPSFAYGVGAWLERETDDIHLSFGATGGEQMMAEIERRGMPDVVLMDIGMKGMDGFECVQWLNRQERVPAIIGLSLYNDWHSVMHLLGLGALGFLDKEASVAEMIAAVRTAYRGDYFLNANVTEERLAALDNRRRRNMGFTERELLYLYYCHKGLKDSEMAEAMFISVNTVRDYRKKLAARLGLHTKTQLVAKAMELGLLQKHGHGG